MDTHRFLAKKNLDVAVIVASAKASVGLASDDILLSVGSLAEGIGNCKSDLDLLLITIREVDAIAVVVEECLFDIDVSSPNELRDICAKFNTWTNLPWNTTRQPGVSHEERRLLHRLIHSVVIFEGVDALAVSLPKKEELARLKFQLARHMSKAVQVDMEGSFADGDYASLMFSSQELLGHAADALAAGYHLTNPNPKWRCKLLDRLPPSWERSLRVRPTGESATERFCSLHRAPRQIDRSGTLRHAHRILAFARAIFAWAEDRLLEETGSEPLTWPSSEPRDDDIPLPVLKLDVDFVRDGEHIRLSRLNEFAAAPVDLSISEAAILPLMDGATTIGEAEIALCSGLPQGSGRGIATRLIKRLSKAGLCMA